MPARKILVIDDSKFMRKTVKNMLTSSNCDITEAENGIEGLKLIRSEQPNLVVLDFNMPKIGGWDVYQAMLQDNTLRAIPVIFMSGRPEELTDEVTRHSSFFAFLSKPFDQKQLFNAFKEAIQKASTRVPVAAGTPPPEHSGKSASAAEFITLQKQVKAMQGEINTLKKQLQQLIGFIKHKLK